MTPNNHKATFYEVTEFIANCPRISSDLLPYNERFLVWIIIYFIRCNSDSASNEIQFFNFYDQYKVNNVEQRQRSAVLSFLYLMSRSQSKTFNVENSLYKRSNFIKSLYKFKLNAPFGEINTDDASDKQDAVVPYVSAAKNPRIDKKPNHQMEYDGILQTQILISDFKYYGSQIGSTDELVQDVIYAFTGIQGKYLLADSAKSSFKLAPTARYLTIGQAAMLLRLSELGYYYNRLEVYTSSKKDTCALGMVGQSLITVIKKEITGYYGMVALFQERLNKQRMMKLQGLNQEDKITMTKILAWSIDPFVRLKSLLAIVEACYDKKGGQLIFTVYVFLNNGDSVVKSIVKDVLQAICKPLQQMLSRWVIDGEVCDPYYEFFIQCQPGVGRNQLWHNKYEIRFSMLPTFFSKSMANKILVLGKSINFLQDICKDKTSMKAHDALSQYLESFSRGETNEGGLVDFGGTWTQDRPVTHSMIESAYLTTSKRVLDIVTGLFKLLEHLHTMKRYLLLGQGDFIVMLIANLKCELDRAARDLFSFDLTTIMDAAIRNINIHCGNSALLCNLGVRLKPAVEGDTGWDMLSLQYNVPFPLATILDPITVEYHALFKALWRLKRMELLLSEKIWKDQIYNAKLLQPIRSLLHPTINRLHLFTSELIHFMDQMQYYILFEVVECSWVKFQNEIKTAETVDDILNAHDKFLTIIKIGTFLDKKSEHLSSYLEEVYLSIIRLEIWQDHFFVLCFEKLKSLKNPNMTATKVFPEQLVKTDEDLALFELHLGGFQADLEKIAEDSEIGIRQFILALNTHADTNLQLFGIRLDFNEYYKNRDHRLRFSLTFEHKRTTIKMKINRNAGGTRNAEICRGFKLDLLNSIYIKKEVP